MSTSISNPPGNPPLSTLESILKENRVFEPPKEFAKRAHLWSMEQYKTLCDQARSNPEAFWKKTAENVHWFAPFTKVLSWDPPFARWFEDGTTNVSYNCLDRHLHTRKDKIALLWEGEPGDKRSFTYAELHREVCRFANVLKSLDIKVGDRIAVYMPMVPELVIALLACARVGATHTVIFGGFSASALQDRINDAKCRVVITADGGFRRGKIVELKKEVDAACEKSPSVEKVICLKRTGQPTPWKPSRDKWWHDLMKSASSEHTAPPLPAEHPLFILYTSGTTGKPKGIVHSTGGYLVYATYTAKMIFDLRDEDIYWCTADIGWVTGHTYVLYGILSNGATTLMYEGAPNHPDPARFWKIIDDYKVSIFYTAPTAIRTFMRWGDEYPLKHNLKSLRLLGSVGEPINPEAWIWYHEIIGKKNCPIVDTWWQTETGGIMIAPLPGATPTKPGSATLPLPGVSAEIVDEKGHPVTANTGGMLVLTQPWPGMLRTIHGAPDRYKAQYWSQFHGKYFTGDTAHRDKDGYFWILGRSDDVLKISGHRLGTMEIESALVSHDAVVEAAVVGKPDDIKGQSIVAFVTLAPGVQASDELKAKLGAHVTKEIGAIARPEVIRFAEALPKTRSGKIMRRLLQELAVKGEATGDTTTLEDLNVLEALKHEE